MKKKRTLILNAETYIYHGYRQITYPKWKYLLMKLMFWKYGEVIKGVFIVK